MTNGNNYMHSSGVYFISSELAQDPPLPEHTLQKMKALFTAVDIVPGNLHPSIKVAEKLREIHQQQLIMFEYEHMINERKDDLDLMVEKEMQLRELVTVHSYSERRQLHEKNDKANDHPNGDA